ncbi:MAG: nucleotide disphospho-sugar-binding domain-containing protein, partial [Anaerolineae bacterium]
LADQDMLVVVTTGNRPLSELGPLPANVRAAPFIPYDRLLPHVDLLVTNGGYGTVQMTLAHGVPIVAAGKTEEKAEICARVAWAGVGIGLKTNSPGVKQIQRAVLQVLDTPTFRQNAQRLGDDFARYDAPKRAVALIEQLIAGRQVSNARNMQTDYSCKF